MNHHHGARTRIDTRTGTARCEKCGAVFAAVEFVSLLAFARDHREACGKPLTVTAATLPV